MDRRQFGSSPPEVAVIGRGTWTIDRGNRARAVSALRPGLDLGMIQRWGVSYFEL